MTITASDFIDRIKTLQEAAVSGSKSFGFALYQHGKHPYWTNEISVESIDSLDPTHDRYNVTVTMRLKRGMVTQGYDGSLETTVIQDIFNVCAYFRKRPSLSLEVGSKPDITGMIPRSATITGRIARFSETPDSELGAAFTLTFQIGDRNS